MDKEKFNAVIGYFEEENIQLPTEVKNAIEDVFLENDDIEGVECYHPEDIEQFQEDLTLTNFVKMTIGGSNEGETNNIWTYYGNVTYSLSEAIILVDDQDEIIEEISKIENDEPTIVESRNHYAVVLRERVSWNAQSKAPTRETVLYIYCPVSVETEEDKYKGIYQEIKEEYEGGYNG